LGAYDSPQPIRKGETMMIEWWHWAVLGVALMVVELILPTMVLVWFGLGALLVAGAHFLFPDLSLIAKLLIWIISSVGLVVLWFKVFRPAHHKTLIGRSSAEAIGEVGLLVGNVGPFQKSQVRFQKPLFGSDVWDCIADEEIKAGERVKVAAVEGSILKITKKGGH
jgi:membrane protein implicated in regulation of membrane protease activity